MPGRLSKAWQIAAPIKLVVGGFLGTGVLRPDAAGALACGTLGTQFDGMVTGADSLRDPVSGSGVRGQIEEYNPRICDSVGNASAWIAMANSHHPTAIAQEGYLKIPGFSSHVQYFDEWGLTNGFDTLPVTHGYLANPGGANNINDGYTVYTDSSGVTHFSHNGINDDHGTLDWTLDSTEFLGEKKHTGDQMTGDTVNTTYFHALQKLYNGSWINLNAAGNMGTAAPGVTCSSCASNVGGANDFAIWDTRYSSD